MKTLYFDIDGTILLGDQYAPKPCLASGQLEAHIRNAGFEKLVCVGNLAGIIRMVKELGVELDEFEALISFCQGTFVDVVWFRSVTSLVASSDRRTEHIDFSEDWWYVDDLAAEYLREAHQEDILLTHRGERVLIPSPTGSGQDILDWLERSVLRPLER